MKFRLRPDWISVLTILALMAIGLIMIFSTSSAVGLTYYNDGYYFIRKHIFFLLAGVVAFFVGCLVPHRQYKSGALYGLIFSSALLLATFLPGLGVKTLGACRWLHVGLFQFQPVELAKFFVIVYLSVFLENKLSSEGEIHKKLAPLFIAIAVPLALLGKQPDLGNAILLLSIVLVSIFLAGVDWKWIGAILGGGALVTTVYILHNAYQMDRVRTFLFPWKDPLGKSYHIIQSFIAIGSGGVFGLGLGEGKLKYFYLPLHYSDFIFSIICEEGGMLMAGLVVFLFALLFSRGMVIAFRSESRFSFYLALGLTLLLILQALINLSMATGLFPVTGIPLTFISFGGTSMVMSLFFAGVLQNINASNHREKGPKE